MPSSIIHRCISKRVLEKTNLFVDNKDIYLYDIGSIAPDSWKNSSRFKDSILPKKEKRKYSHFSNDDEYFENYDRFLDKYKSIINNPFMIGYLVHLLTDIHWRETMFYRCFDEDGSVIMLDGSTLNGEKGVRKTLLNQESKKMAYLLFHHYNLNELKLLSCDELDFLPKMDEIEFDGLNDTIKYSNSANEKDFDGDLLVYKKDEFVIGIEECSDYIIDLLIDKEIIKR